LTTKLLTDSEGRKIGKTTGNAINLFGDPKDLFGQIMALADSVIAPAFELATNLSLEEIGVQKQLAESDPMQAKKNLAFAVVKLCHSKELAQNRPGSLRIHSSRRPNPN